MLSIPLTDSTFRDLRDYIYEKCGIYISDTKKYLIENRLSRILQEKNLNSFEKYLELIKFHSNGNEMNRLFDAITTNETYFFREPEQLDVLVNEVLPVVSSQKRNIKIWSAACSSGEEPFTISIMLKNKFLNNSQFEIIGSDLSESVLHSAKQAVYNSYSVRNVDASYLGKYFAAQDKSYILKDEIKRTVQFTKVNLIDESTLRLIRNVDIILCRNVLIYFDTKAKQKVISNLYNALNPGGYLIIGSSESLHSVTRAFRPSTINKVVLYQKL
jgi:chemotaxis protein methyltransferase CheR